MTVRPDTSLAKASLAAAIRAINYDGGNTNTTGGLRLMRTQIFNSANGDRPNVPDVAILITDGVPTLDVDELLEEVHLDWAANIHIVGVGVTNAVSPCMRTYSIFRTTSGDF